jgi:two-component system response regulator WspF
VSTPLSEGPGTDALLSKLRTLDLLIGNADIVPTRMRPGNEEGTKEPIILIGASAGGPAALAVILGSLPRDFSCSIVVAQHVDAQFADPMAHWLNGQSALTVRVAIDGERPQPGHVLLAGQDAHLTFNASGRLSYRRELTESLYCPSIDLFFESVIGHWDGKVSAVLLTGMGSDGARGMKTLKESGAFTIAQDKNTSVVFGMPKRAISLGAASEILPLERIGPALSHFADQSPGRRSLSHVD